MSPYSIKAFLVFGFFTITGFDLYLALDGKRGNTYSEILRMWFVRNELVYYLFAFAMGVLMGHWGPT